MRPSHVFVLGTILVWTAVASAQTPAPARPAPPTASATFSLALTGDSILTRRL